MFLWNSQTSFLFLVYLDTYLSRNVKARIFSQKEIAEVSEQAGLLTQVQIAEYFNCTDKTFRAAMKRQPELERAYNKGRIQKGINVAEVLYEKALAGHFPSIKFYLESRFGWSAASVQRRELQEEAERRAEEGQGNSNVIEIVRATPAVIGL